MTRSDYVLAGEGKTGYLQEPKKGWRRILARAELYYVIEAIAKARHWSEKQLTQARFAAVEDEVAAAKQYRAEAAKLKIDLTNAALKDLRIHDLRRTFGSWQAATGASLVVIGASLGHKDVSTTAIYARLSVDPVRDAVEKATGAMLSAAGLGPKAAVVKLPKRKTG